MPQKLSAKDLARDRQRRRRQRLAQAGVVTVTLPVPSGLLRSYEKIARRDDITRTAAMARALKTSARARPSSNAPKKRRLPRVGVHLSSASTVALQQLWDAVVADRPRQRAIAKALEALIGSLRPSTSAPSESLEATLATEARRLRELAANARAAAGSPPDSAAMVGRGQGPSFATAHSNWLKRFAAAEAFDAAAARLERP